MELAGGRSASWPLRALEVLSSGRLSRAVTPTGGSEMYGAGEVTNADSCRSARLACDSVNFGGTRTQSFTSN